MKKFLIGILTVLLILFSAQYLMLRQGLYINFRPNAPISTPFRTEGKTILRFNERGAWEPFVLRGVDVSSSMPGHYATEFAANEADYLRWFEDIYAMGANTVRAYTVMDDDFYNAFYTFNMTHESPLYLLQGILVSDRANTGKADAYDDNFLGSLLEDGRDVIDIIHGQKIIPINKMRGSGYYKKDVSPWVVGFLVGQDWNSETVAYTNHEKYLPQQYHGAYFTTTAEASAFEAMLAKVMDDMMAYETGKYKEQRLIAFINDPANDPFTYEPSYAAQLRKYNCLDAEHILPTGAVQSGYFAAYRLYDFCADFSQYLSDEQKAELGSLYTELNTDVLYDGYLQLLAQYHTMPVVAAGYGFSTARGAVTMERAPLTEKAQGRALVALYDALMDADWSGVFLSTWQDTWERRTWNTAFATVLSKNYQWHDLQSEGQNFGLLAFDPGPSEKVCTLDGKTEDWTTEDIILQTDVYTLSAQFDAEGLYLLIQGDVSPQQAFYVPIDVTDGSGSYIADNASLVFDRAADFLLCLDGTANSRLLVQERYDALRENFLFEITGENPFVQFPAADSHHFVPIKMALRNDTLIDEEIPYEPEQLRKMRALGVWETGLLRHGCNDPGSPTYDSLADFCWGDNAVEIRLPWLLLNVGDPSAMSVHNDYYKNYGVTFHQISQLWLGFGDGTEPISLVPMALQGWNEPQIHERLKASYSIVQDAWKEEDSFGSDH